MPDNNVFHYQIFDLHGIEKKSGQIENKINISIHDITNGNYIISITSKNGNQGSQPFIILHYNNLKNEANHPNKAL